MIFYKIELEELIEKYPAEVKKLLLLLDIDLKLLDENLKKLTKDIDLKIEKEILNERKISITFSEILDYFDINQNLNTEEMIDEILNHRKKLLSLRENYLHFLEQNNNKDLFDKFIDKTAGEVVNFLDKFDNFGSDEFKLGDIDYQKLFLVLEKIKEMKSKIN